MRKSLYEVAKEDLDFHESLNDTIPPEFGCAQAWSALATRANVQNIPLEGFNNVSQIDQFCSLNPSFELILEPELGATIISLSTSSHHGHVGVIAKYNLQYENDWGIISNDSHSGTMREQWSYKAWLTHYYSQLGLVIHLYRLR